MGNTTKKVNIFNQYYQKKSGLKILIVRPDAIGDVVLIIPLINTLKANFPQAKINVLLREYTRPILENHKNVDNVIIDWRKTKKLKFPWQYFQYLFFLKKQNFDERRDPRLYALRRGICALDIERFASMEGDCHGLWRA